MEKKSLKTTQKDVANCEHLPQLSVEGRILTIRNVQVTFYTKNPPQTTLRGIFVEHRRYENLLKDATGDSRNHYSIAMNCMCRYWNSRKNVTFL